MRFPQFIRTLNNPGEPFGINPIDPMVDYEFDIIEQGQVHINKLRYTGIDHHPVFYGVSITFADNRLTNVGLHFSDLSRPVFEFALSTKRYQGREFSGRKPGIFIVFNKLFLLRNTQIAERITELPFNQATTGMLHIDDPTESIVLENACTSVIDEYKSKDNEHNSMLLSYVHVLVVQLRKLYVRYSVNKHMKSDTSPQPNSYLIDKFMLCVKNHVCSGEMEEEARFVNFYAVKLFVHPNHLNATVKRITGKPAIEIVHRQIIEEARSLLLETELLVKEIAYRLAFKEPSHFNAFFRKHTGVTPVSYRLRACA